MQRKQETDHADNERHRNRGKKEKRRRHSLFRQGQVLQVWGKSVQVPLQRNCGRAEVGCASTKKRLAKSESFWFVLVKTGVFSLGHTPLTDINKTGSRGKVNGR